MVQGGTNLSPSYITATAIITVLVLNCTGVDLKTMKPLFGKQNMF